MEIDKENRLREAIANMVDLAGKKILQVGCWDGRMLEILQRPDNEIVGVELRLRIVHALRARFPDTRFERSDFLQVDLGTERFDLIVFSSCLHHFSGGVDEKIFALNKARGLLRSNGKILVVEPDEQNLTCRAADRFVDETRGIAQTQAAIKRWCAARAHERRTVTVRCQVNGLSEFCELFYCARAETIPAEFVDLARAALPQVDWTRPFAFDETYALYLL